ncbi:unnamed protein product [Cunninghamella blakesleeana]
MNYKTITIFLIFSLFNLGCFSKNVDPCMVPKESGMCLAYFPKYHYDTALGKCQEFVYGGCGGNENRFDTLDHCEEKCIPIKQMEKNGTVVPQEKKPCYEPLVVGLCQAVIPKWYYNPRSGHCKRFTYGGCGANGNNFNSFKECHALCAKN